MPTDLDLLMARVAEINAEPDPSKLTAQDIKALVIYHRHNRAKRAAGIKTARPEKPKLDIMGLLNLETAKLAPKPVAPPTAGGTGIRRI